MWFGRKRKTLRPEVQERGAVKMEPKQKILIVDDSEINRAMLKEILGEGYEYLEAENGLRAIEILRRRTDIALVLLDLIMPEMDGFDVLRVMQCYAWQ